MTTRRVGEYLVGLASGLIFLSSFAHGLLGWPELESALQGRVGPDVLGALGVGWHFGSVSMATFGLLGILSVAQMRKGRAGANWTPALIGAAYTIFGVAAFFYRGFSPHFGFFVVLGLLLVAGALLGSRQPARPGGPS
jgi:hypothetical protein